ncbi:MAG: hypothetical protein WCI18_05705 [Pseudomonadota bacterium]
MAAKISSYFFILFSWFLITAISMAVELRNPRCLLVLIDGDKKCWSTGITNSLPKGSPIKILGLRPRQAGSPSLQFSGMENDAVSKTLLSPYSFGDLVEVPKDRDFFELSVMEKGKVIFAVLFKTVEPKFYYAVVGINGKEQVLQNGSKTSLSPQADFEIKDLKTNLQKGVSVKVVALSSRQDEFQILYSGQVIGRLFFEKRGKL